MLARSPGESELPSQAEATKAMAKRASPKGPWPERPWPKRPWNVETEATAEANHDRPLERS